MIKVLHNPRCSKSRQTLEILNKNSSQYEVREYLKDPLSIDEIKKLLSLLGQNVFEILRKKEDEYSSLGVETKSESEAIRLLSENPKLLERPIVINGDKAVIARPPELALNIL